MVEFSRVLALSSVSLLDGTRTKVQNYCQILVSYNICLPNSSLHLSTIFLHQHHRTFADNTRPQQIESGYTMTPHFIFGTASFGMDLTKFQDPSSVETILKILPDLGIHRLDSGARYPPMKPGRAEELIGETSELSARFVVDTKVYTDTQKDGSGDLTPEAIEKSVHASLQRLKKPDGVGSSLDVHLCIGRVFLTKPDFRSTSSMRTEPTLPRRSKSRSSVSTSRLSKVIVRV